MTTTRRARPWLGTLVDVRIDDVAPSRALEAIEAAFAEIADVHRLMSFHVDDSDITRINREGAKGPVAVDARTHEVIALALEIACASAGRFDPTVAAELVEWGLLPPPRGAPTPARGASWRDVVSLDDGRIRCSQAVWIDLGGIAKGYAVDRAIERIASLGIEEASVNAGGDLRRIGRGNELVHIRLPSSPHDLVPGLMLGNGSVASSGGYFESRWHRGRRIGPHVDGVSRCSLPVATAVSVVADRCAIADALTKVVIADPEAACPLLATYDAEACVHDATTGWRAIGRAA